MLLASLPTVQYPLLALYCVIVNHACDNLFVICVTIDFCHRTFRVSLEYLWFPFEECGRRFETTMASLLRECLAVGK